MTAPVVAALGALAAAVWFGRDPIDVLHAGNKLASTLADAGTLSRIGGSDSRPSGAGRRAARASRFTYVLVGQRGVHGE